MELLDGLDLNALIGRDDPRSPGRFCKTSITGSTPVGTSRIQACGLIHAWRGRWSLVVGKRFENRTATRLGGRFAVSLPVGSLWHQPRSGVVPSPGSQPGEGRGLQHPHARTTPLAWRGHWSLVIGKRFENRTATQMGWPFRYWGTGREAA